MCVFYRVPVQVVEIVRDEIVVNAALGGENLRLKLSGIDEDEIQTGFVICDRRNPVPAVTSFEAQLQVSHTCPEVAMCRALQFSRTLFLEDFVLVQLLL